MTEKQANRIIELLEEVNESLDHFSTTFDRMSYFERIIEAIYALKADLANSR